MKPNNHLSGKKKEVKPKVNNTALFSWIAVVAVTVVFWVVAVIAYQDDYMPRAIAKMHHKEKKFLSNHKALQRKLVIIRNSIV